MSYEQMLAAVAAVGVAAWPTLKAAAAWLTARRPDAPVAPAVIKPPYGEAMADLQSVRLRLVRTDCLAQDQKNAIDVLTLALVDGSDK
ncbi:MAG: hypothetical protein EBR82_60610 [Caulobacteraceae bacterium]|nr:hypothetical protein [Caulobacteraceae bacterium]